MKIIIWTDEKIIETVRNMAKDHALVAEPPYISVDDFRVRDFYEGITGGYKVIDNFDEVTLTDNQILEEYDDAFFDALRGN